MKSFPLNREIHPSFPGFSSAAEVEGTLNTQAVRIKQRDERKIADFMLTSCTCFRATIETLVLDHRNRQTLSACDCLYIPVRHECRSWKCNSRERSSPSGREKTGLREDRSCDRCPRGR